MTKKQKKTNEAPDLWCFPSNQIEALTLALVLGLTAPTDKKAEKAIEFAEDLAQRMSPKEIKQAKKEAQRILKEIDHAN
jgi:hypothetical protein